MSGYLDVEPEPSKWYVSEGFKAGNTHGQGIDPALVAHNLGRNRMILAGPFDSEVEALQACKAMQDRCSPFVWKCQ